MTRVPRIAPEFTPTLPPELAAGVLYVSHECSTMIHLCCCGCGLRVVTPLSPVAWSYEYNGETISVTPSVGNWSQPCQSHYWITRGRVRWAPQWTRKQIERGRDRDGKAREKFYGTR